MLNGVLSTFQRCKTCHDEKERIEAAQHKKAYSDARDDFKEQFETSIFVYKAANRYKE